MQFKYCILKLDYDYAPVVHKLICFSKNSNAFLKDFIKKFLAILVFQTFNSL